MSDRFIVLHGHASSLVLEQAGDTVLWRYWGPRLADDITLDALVRPVPSFSLDHDVPLSLFPTFGMGWFGQSALLAHRMGSDFAQDFTGCAVERIDASKIRFDLTDDIAGLCAAVVLALDPVTDVLTMSSTLTNTGAAPLDVQWLAAGCLPLPPSARSVRSWGGRHNNEFVEGEDVLGGAVWRRENRRGLTSHEDFPGAVVLGDHGAAWGAQLAWSGNHNQTIEALDDGRRQWQLGEWLAPGEVRLAPGEILHSPEVLATFSSEGPNGVAQNFHAAIRARMTWPGGAMRPRPVHLNTWEAVYFDHNPEDLTALADAAAEIGIERFVLDDGWFKGRNDDTSSLGDWTTDLWKYPDGLKPLADHVEALGMEFGLWVEPEMVNPDSDLFRAHPDWALQIMGRPQPTARSQLVLDMATAEVGDYLFEALSALLTDLPIVYLKWDHNRALAPAAGADGRPSYRRQLQGTYALLDRMRAAFPDVEIESCAGGGGRIDAGIAIRTHRFWTSDNNDALSRVAIQRGFLQFMPPELMGAHIGASPAHATGRRQSLDFRAMVAAPGHLGVEMDPRRLEPGERDRLAAWIARYKDWRGALHLGRTWIGDAADSISWQAQGDAQSLLLFVYRLAPPTRRYTTDLPLPMLDPAHRYRVACLFPDGPDRELDGSWLASNGLPLPDLKAERGMVFRIYAIDC
jgi:alpha-galactosidase